MNVCLNVQSLSPAQKEERKKVPMDGWETTREDTMARHLKSLLCH